MLLDERHLRKTVFQDFKKKGMGFSKSFYICCYTVGFKLLLWYKFIKDVDTQFKTNMLPRNLIYAKHTHTHTRFSFALFVFALQLGL